MKYTILIFVVMLTLFSCKKSRQSKQNENNQSVQIIVSDEVIYPKDSIPLVINMVSGIGKAEIHKEKNQGITIKFNSSNYTKLHGVLTSADSTANIRFTQIFMPNGTMDGPFGREINYDLKVNSDYMLLIHENMMAGDPWEGDFTVTINLGN